MAKIGKRGFSLIELLIGMAIFALIFAAVCTVLPAGIAAFQADSAQSRNMQQAGTIMNIIADKARYAKTISSPALDGTASAALTFTSAGGSYNIYLGSGSDANTLLFVENGTTTRYGIGAVRNISFKYYKNAANNTTRQLDITITLSDRSTTLNPDYSLTTTIVLANSP